MNVVDLKEFPSTRFRGSKRKLLPWIYDNINGLKFNSALDIFGGSSSVSYLFKKMGKRVTYNDYLLSNALIGKAVIENSSVLLSEKDIKFLLTKHKSIKYDSFVQETFPNMYYTDDENVWIDMFLGNWKNMNNLYPDDELVTFKKSLGFYAFAQSAMKKRPFNLFHRANLNLRLRKVSRKFGNKTSWEGEFSDYFIYFAKEVNRYVFDNGKNNIALNNNASKYNGRRKYDLVYIDPPYISEKGRRTEIDYLRCYHFLEGICDSDNWESRINFQSKNHRIDEDEINEWVLPDENLKAFGRLFERFSDSTLVISYKEPGFPSKRSLIHMLKKFKKNVTSVPGLHYNYALNKNNGFHKEYMLIGTGNEMA